MPKPSALAVVAPAVTREQLELVKRTVAPEATDDELLLFLHDCKRRGVDPLDRRIHFTKRNGRYTPIVSIDYMRSQAADTGDMAGSEDPIFAYDDEGQPLAATVTVYRLTKGQRFAYTATARWPEYYPGAGGAGAMYRKMPHTMLGKCAEALALRKAYPQQLGGLYADEELHQADRGELLPDRRDRTGHTEAGRPDSAVVESAPASTGRVPSLPPKGYVLLTKYYVDKEWHHVHIGPNHYKTKLGKIGALLQRAYTERTPVALDITPNKKEGEAGYVNQVRFLETADELAALEATRDPADDPPA